MIKIGAVQFMFIIELLLIFLGLTVFLFLKQRNHTNKERNFELGTLNLKVVIEELEKENEKLNQKIKDGETKSDNIFDISEEVVEKGDSNNLQAENETMKEKIRELMEELENKNKDYETLQKNYNNIEQEYLAVYHDIKKGVEVS